MSQVLEVIFRSNPNVWFFVFLLVCMAGLAALVILPLIAASQGSHGQLRDRSSVFARLEAALKSQPDLDLLSCQCDFRIQGRRHVPILTIHGEHHHTRFLLECWRDAIDDVRRQPMRGQLSLEATLFVSPPSPVCFAIEQRDDAPTVRWELGNLDETLCYLDAERAWRSRQICEDAARALGARAWRFSTEGCRVMFCCDFDARSDAKGSSLSLLLAELEQTLHPRAVSSRADLFTRWGEIDDPELSAELGRRWLEGKEPRAVCETFASLPEEQWTSRWRELEPSQRSSFLSKALRTLDDACLVRYHSLLAVMLRELPLKERGAFLDRLEMEGSSGEQLASLLVSGGLTLASDDDRRGGLEMCSRRGTLSLA